MSDTYDRRTAKLAARIIESFPEVPADVMQHCIQNTPRIMAVIKKLLERDAVLQHGIWCTLPKDEAREHGLVSVSDKSLARAQVALIARAANCWDSYTTKHGTELPGMVTTLEAAQFGPQRLVKIPVEHIKDLTDGSYIRPGWVDWSGLTRCALETGFRCWLRQKNTPMQPGEKILFYASALVTAWSGEYHYFWINVPESRECSLHIVQEPRVTDFTHVVFREDEIGIE